MEIMQRAAAAILFGGAFLSAQPAVVGAGYSSPYPIKVAPGHLLTFFVNGVGSTITSRTAAQSLPLPFGLAGISATIDELSVPPLLKEKVPLLAVAPMSGGIALTVQIPFGLRTSSFLSPLIPPPATLTIYENGTPATTIPIGPVPDQVHIATTCDANLTTPVPGDLCRPVIAHLDGSLVVPDHPAHPGELLVLYAFGLGATNPGVGTGEASPSPSQPVGSQFTLSFEAAIPVLPSERRSVAPVFAGLTAGFAGLYQINFVAPAPPTPFAPADCNTFSSPNGNTAITVRGQSSDAASFCVFR